MSNPVMPQEKWSDYASPTGPDTRQADMGGWLPIESAPRDGTEVLMFGELRAGGGLYRNMEPKAIITTAFWEHSQWQAGKLCPFFPTHWQPLPAPPESET